MSQRAEMRVSGPAGRLIWTDDMRRRVVDETNAGRTTEDIGRDMGVTAAMVTNVRSQMRSRGLSVRYESAPAIVWTAEMDEAVRAGLLAGQRVRDVAGVCGVRPKDIHNRAAALGLTEAARRARVKLEQQAMVRRVARKAEKEPHPPHHPMPERGIARDFPHRITLTGLTLTTCRYPTWPHAAQPRPDDAFYCGAPIAPGAVYCPDCRGFVFVPRAQGRVA